MPLKLKNKFVGVLVLICAVVLEFLIVILLSVAYNKGHYYQTVNAPVVPTGVNVQVLIYTGEDQCEVIAESLEARRKQMSSGGYPVSDDKKISCPDGDIAFASVICAGISTLFSSITLGLQLLGKSDILSQLAKTWLMVAASFGMCIVGLLLIWFLISITNSNYPCTSDAEVKDVLNIKMNGRTVESRAASFPRLKDVKSCVSYTNYMYKNKLLIVSTVFAIISSVFSIISTVFHLKESRAVGDGMVMSGKQQDQPLNEVGQTPSNEEGQTMTPSQSQVPQAQQQQQKNV